MTHHAGVVEEYVHPLLVYSDSNQHVKIDTYVPSKNLGFEYQGVQHYTPSSSLVYGITPSVRDSEKRRICMEAGLTIIEVRF